MTRKIVRAQELRAVVAPRRSEDLAHMRRNIPHVDDFIHLNAAAGALADQCVLDAMVAHLDLEARCGNTEARFAVAEQIDDLYCGLARLTRAPVSRISLAESHTAAWQRAFQAIPLREGDRILVGETEWGGNLSAIWQRVRMIGARMDVVPSDPTGAIDSKALTQMLDGRVKLVCVTLAPAINGLVNPMGPILQALAGHPAWLFVDAAQAFANVLQDLSEPRFDLVTVSGRKYLRGPRGTGFATNSQRFLDEVVPLGLDQFSGPWTGPAPVPRSGARRFEFVETSFAVRLGFKAAVDFTLRRDITADMRRIAELADYTRRALGALPAVSVQDTHETLSGIVTFTHASRSPVEIQGALKAKSICVAAPGEHYAPLWMRAGRPAITRLSPHAFNTEAEIDTTVTAIAAL